MSSSDLETKLKELIDSIANRNKEVQAKKENGSLGSYILAVVLALISTIAIAYATYLANKRTKELATARTELEQLKVDLVQKEHQLQVEKQLDKQAMLAAEVRVMTGVIQARDAKLTALNTLHMERQKKLEGLKAWGEINEA